MPNFSAIEEQIRRKGAYESPHDVVRRIYLRKFCRITGRNAILYYSGWVQKPTMPWPLTSITDDDKNGFMAAVHGMDTSKGLDLILHTPGGDLAAAESIVSYLAAKFGGDMRAVIPHLAMSAGTVIARACKEIIMGKQSSLGPIDPQINGVPASSILAEFREASKAVGSARNKATIWHYMLPNYSPGLIEVCRKAASWSDVLARKYLEYYMFKEGGGKASSKGQGAIDGIVKLLTDHAVTKSHSRHIPMAALKKAGMRVSSMEADQDLQDTILSVHHASASTMSNTPAVKIIESPHRRPFVISHGSA